MASSDEKKEISYNESANYSVKEISRWNVSIGYHIQFGILSIISFGFRNTVVKSYMEKRDG
ncbi:hypothetical protein DSCW_52500 [Desulfosarcina widdelii]|uniref:Uncharacterized protein n=1 Tax=Desulfosarcina widdelii TaxID=947919 RepID=A0A5K7ZDP9_9BACT|nr:hypothetical protein DSCW_52500 [Desulfosarcina widdelii]